MPTKVRALIDFLVEKRKAIAAIALTGGLYTGVTNGCGSMAAARSSVTVETNPAKVCAAYLSTAT
ncbi:hypothetical protein [Burkholderia stabilis]|uniref:hypothetical protein n=1 Tax=Burkholderia stabilis TaxID=95485 RepID=UPI001F4BBD6A|nr:hypothetical protein [Burkholderia stabilis]